MSLPSDRIAARSLSTAAALLLAASTALGQATPATKDARASDSVATDARGDSAARKESAARADSVRRAQGPEAGMIYLYAAVIAPGAIAALEAAEPPDSVEARRPPLGYARDHVALYGTGGLASGGPGPVLGASWTGSASVEALVRGAYVELRAERFRLFDSLAVVEYRTARVGWLLRPYPEMAGGVTIGYRSARNLPAHEGWEVAFPFVGGRPNGWVRLETAYVMGTHQSSWNYRVQGERRLWRGPLVVGANVELKSWAIRNHGRLSHGTFALLVGTMLPSRWR